MFENILENKKGKKVVLLGNEAIVRGALEAGVNFVSTYPGTPSSEIGNIFYKMYSSGKFKGYFEFSTNEKVAMEAGIGASFSGLKTLVAMKNFGLNVALDALLPFVYTGSKGPTVIIVADDPSCHSSAQSEENSRFLASLAHIPILEPSDPQECKEFVKLGFALSKQFEIPVIVRTTTRVAHQRSLVELNSLSSNKFKGSFQKNPDKFITLPPRVLEMKKELFLKIEKIKSFAEKSDINKSFKGKSGLGIITSGISYLYAKESLARMDLDLGLLKLGFFNPLPVEKIEKFIKSLPGKQKKILILEELEPYLEKEVFILAKKMDCQIEVVGKKKDFEIGELSPDKVDEIIADFAGYKGGKEKKDLSYLTKDLKSSKRAPRLCPGCPYWLVVSAVKKAVDIKKVVFGGEIGCYMLFGSASIKMQDYLFCMGSSVGIGHGIKKAIAGSNDKKLISFVGDSSFFHAGIPPLINAVINKSNPLIIILQNDTTAMTGHQPHPGAFNVQGRIKIEDVVRGCGVKNLKVIDPVNQKEFIETIKKFLKNSEVSVIIVKKQCIQI